MKRKILAGVGIAALMAFLVGCDEIKFGGMLGVHEQMTFTQSRAAGNGQVVSWDLSRAGGTAVLNPGQFQTKITMGQSGNNKELTMEVANANPATVIKMKFDKNINIGENFTITAAQLGQNFDLTGTLATKVDKSPEQSGYESCTYQYPQTVCRSAAKSADPAAEKAAAEISKFGPNNGFPYPGQIPSVPNPQYNPYPGQYPGPYPGQFNNPPGYTPVCNTMWVTRPGNMYVRFYYETTTRDINAKFVQGAKNLADYTGQASDTQKINTYQGSCN